MLFYFIDKTIGSISKLAVTHVSCGDFTAQSASWSCPDGLNLSESKHRNTMAAMFESLSKPRRKKNHVNSEDDAQVERRISVRQTESAFRFKEIVVRKCSKYMHLVTLSQTPAKNAFNPKVSGLTQFLFEHGPCCPDQIFYFLIVVLYFHVVSLACPRCGRNAFAKQGRWPGIISL